MNNLYKLLAFVCLVFFTSAINAQTGSVQSNGRLEVNTSLPWQDEYVINIGHLGFNTYAEASAFFDKYIRALGTNGQFSFDLANNKLYLKVKRENSLLVGNLTPESLNYFLIKVYEN